MHWVHELSIALSIIEGAEEEVERQGGGRVLAVYLKLGPLSGVVREALLFSYDLAREGTLLEGSDLLIEDVPISVECSTCGVQGAPISGQQLHCSACGSWSCRVIRGAELELSALELQT